MEYKGCNIKLNSVKEGGDKGKFVWVNSTSGDESAQVFNNIADAWEDAKQFIDENIDDGDDEA